MKKNRLIETVVTYIIYVYTYVLAWMQDMMLVGVYLRVYPLSSSIELPNDCDARTVIAYISSNTCFGVSKARPTLREQRGVQLY